MKWKTYVDLVLWTLSIILRVFIINEILSNRRSFLFLSISWGRNLSQWCEGFDCIRWVKLSCSCSGCVVVISCACFSSPSLAPAVHILITKDWVTKGSFVTKNCTVCTLICALLANCNGNILGKTDHVINFTFISGGSVKNVISCITSTLSSLISAQGFLKFWHIVYDNSDLSHDSLVEMDLIEHVMELVSHTGWSSEHS